MEKQITVLSAQPSKNGAFAQALGIRPETVPGYLRSLTPVQLALDTRVTNHGYRGGKSTEYQAVLQAGTAVMVDDRGVPRVRCACGNPLGPPVPLTANPERHGRPWSSYQPAKAVAIAPAAKTVDKFVIYDHRTKQWYERGRGFRENAQHDKPVPPPRVVPKPPWPPGTPTRTWNPGDKTSQPPPPQPRTSPPTKAPRTGEPPSGKTSSEGTPSRSPDGGPRSEPPPAAVLASALAALFASAAVLGPAAVLARGSAAASAEQRVRPGEPREPGESGDLAAADPAEERGRAGGTPVPSGGRPDRLVPRTDERVRPRCPGAGRGRGPAVARGPCPARGDRRAGGGGSVRPLLHGRLGRNPRGRLAREARYEPRAQPPRHLRLGPRQRADASGRHRS
ncbi:hypothetical protein GCM10020254_71410 [Streptomyces goshikiensis]